MADGSLIIHKKLSIATEKYSMEAQTQVHSEKIKKTISLGTDNRVHLGN